MYIGVGIIEIILLTIVTISATAILYYTKQRWVLGLPAFFVVAIAFTPADPLTTLLIAIPCCFIYSLPMIKINLNSQS